MPAALYTALDNLRSALATIPGVVTCRIGLEAAITPSDYPLIRIVPMQTQNARTLVRRRCGIVIYAGLPIHEGVVGLASVYDQLLDLEASIIAKLEAGGSNYISGYTETVFDGDGTEAFKLLAIRGWIEV